MTPRLSEGLEQTPLSQRCPVWLHARYRWFSFYLPTLMASASLRQLHWVHYVQLHRSDEGKTLTTTLKKTVSEHNELSLFQLRLNLSTLARHYPWSMNPYCLSWCVKSAHLNWKHVLKHLWCRHTSFRNSSAAALTYHTFHGDSTADHVLCPFTCKAKEAR